MEIWEIVAVLSVTIFPTVFVMVLVNYLGKALDDGFICLALLIFVALILLWILARVFTTKKNNNGHGQGRTMDEPEVIVRTTDTKSPSATNPTPILAPIFSNLSGPRLDMTPTTSGASYPTYLEIPAYRPHGTGSNSSKLFTLSGKKKHEHALPTYEVATAIDVPPPTYADFMSIELST